MKENKVIAYSFLLAFILWFLPFVLRLFVVEIPQMDILLLEEKFPQIENSAIHETINLLSAGDKLGAFWAIFKNNLKGCVINSTGGVFFGLGTLFNLVFNGFFSADMFASSYRNGMSIPAILKVTLPHSFELIGFLLSGAIGFYIAWHIIQFMRGKEILISKFYKTTVTGSLAVFIIILSAAYVEAYISVNMLK